MDNIAPYVYRDLFGKKPTKRQMRVPEKLVLRSIMVRYEFDRRLFIWRVNTGAGKFKYAKGGESQFLRFGLKGQPDIMGMLKLPSGVAQFIGIEVKASDGKQSPEQEAWQQACEAKGGLYILARGVDDVENAIREALA